MIAPELNVLPPERKAILRTEVMLLRSRKTLIVLTVTIAIILAGLYGASLILEQAVRSQQNALAQIRLGSGEETLALDANIKELNAKLVRMNSLEQNYTPWTPIVNDLFEAIPEGINVVQISINREEASASIRGSAKVRDNLIDLQERIESSERFSDASSPITNLLQREDIQFDMSFTVDLK